MIISAISVMYKLMSGERINIFFPHYFINRVTEN